MKKYAAYKPSGVEWLGEVPDHWEVKRLKFVSSGVKTGGTPPSTGPDYFEETGISWYTPGDFGPLRLAEGNKKLNPEAFSKGVCKLFPAGSVLLVGIGATLGRIGLAVEAGGANQQINAILPLENTLPEYLAYYLTAASQGIVASSSASTLGIINQEKTKQIDCLLPPLPEQRAIASFLDERTAHLDGLIRRKEDLLKLLAEQRAALITRAVTRGLDAAAPLQESGVPWLEQVPTHWEVKRLKFVSSGVKTGNTPPSSGIDYFDEAGISWYTPGDFNSLYLAEANKKLLPEAFSEGVCNFFPAGSVLLVGIGATLGKIGLTKRPCGANQQINAILPTQNVQPDYLAYYLSAASKSIISAASASTLGILNQEKTKQIICLQPPLAEQHEIVSFINKGNKRLDKMTDITTREIGKLREYRAALITAAVTGRIDVRAAVAVPELVEA